MMQRGVSVIVSSCSRSGVPSVMRAVGSRVNVDGSHITVFLARSQSGELLQDIADTGRVAVVFSSPRTHLTVQVKSAHARVREADAQTPDDLRRYLGAMEEEIAYVGFGPPYVQAMLAHDPADLVAVELHPEVAFDQTPGARAGAPLPSRLP